MEFKGLRQASGMNMTQFGKYFDIPFRTVQNWEHGVRQCPEYLLKLMQYKLENEGIMKGNTETKQYYTCTEKGDGTPKKQTLEEIMAYFKPDAEEFPYAFKAWQSALNDGTMKSAQLFVDIFVNEVDGIRYHDYVIEKW